MQPYPIGILAMIPMRMPLYASNSFPSASRHLQSKFYNDGDCSKQSQRHGRREGLRSASLVNERGAVVGIAVSQVGRPPRLMESQSQQDYSRDNLGSDTDTMVVADAPRLCTRIDSHALVQQGVNVLTEGGLVQLTPTHSTH